MRYIISEKAPFNNVKNTAIHFHSCTLPPYGCFAPGVHRSDIASAFAL